MSKPRAFDLDRALDLWATGMGSKHIARELGANPTTVCNAILAARVRGDARATRRRFPEFRGQSAAAVLSTLVRGTGRTSIKLRRAQ